MENVSKNSVTFENVDKGHNQTTWDQADFTWDEAIGTWDAIGTHYENVTKNTASPTNVSKS